MLVVVVVVTPAHFAMPIAIDPVAVLVSISRLIVRPTIAGDNATRNAHEGSDRTQYSCPIKWFH
jgi:hypothetical protein